MKKSLRNIVVGAALIGLTSALSLPSISNARELKVPSSIQHYLREGELNLSEGDSLPDLEKYFSVIEKKLYEISISVYEISTSAPSVDSKLLPSPSVDSKLLPKIQKSFYKSPFNRDLEAFYIICPGTKEIFAIVDGENTLYLGSNKRVEKKVFGNNIRMKFDIRGKLSETYFFDILTFQNIPYLNCE